MTQGREFDVVYGIWDGETSTAQSGLEVWRARRLVMALFKTEVSKCQDAGNEDGAALFDDEILALRDREVGGLIYGWVFRYRGADRRERFVGIVPAGLDYRQAGLLPARVTYRGEPVEIEGDQAENYPLGMCVPIRRSGGTRIQMVPVADLHGYLGGAALRARDQKPDPERIASKMALASAQATRESR